MCSHGDCSFTMGQGAHNDRRALHESVLSLLGPIFEGARATAHDLLSPPLLSRLQQLQLHMAVVDAAWKPLAMLSDALQLQRVMLSPTNAIMIPLYEQYGTQTVTAALPFHDRRRPFPTPEAAASADGCPNTTGMFPAVPVNNLYACKADLYNHDLVTQGGVAAANRLEPTACKAA